MPISAVPPKDRLIIALDLPATSQAEALVERLGDAVTFYKIGYQLGFAGGLPLVEALKALVRQLLELSQKTM